MTGYDDDFYDTIAKGCARSAAYVAPIVYDTMGRPSSLIDFGCGEGHWLKAFSDVGVSTVVGLDGNWVDRDRLAIDRGLFHRTDLATASSIDEGHFDMAMSLEVAEHIPGSRADWLVEQLCKAADLVLFSAAIPNQGGTGHVNEQWPDYWVEKFGDRGMRGTGALRWVLWPAVPHVVENWYAQNLLVFASVDWLLAHEDIHKRWWCGDASDPSIAVVHPVLWEHRVQ